MNTSKQVVFGLLGTTLDVGPFRNPWKKWRPTISIFQHDDFSVNRFELLHDRRHQDLADHILADARSLSPKTQLHAHQIDFKDPWDFEEVYGSLLDFFRAYSFNCDKEEYLLHITTGTHVAQICMFLLTESRYFPGKLLQTSPPPKGSTADNGGLAVIDLDLSKYDRLASRFRQESHDDVSFLKSGIKTRNLRFNRIIEQIEQVTLHSEAPILLTGFTGVGKSKLARRIYELKKQRRKVTGAFVEVNCATLRGDSAMSALFGHVAGAFTGAIKERPGLLRAADGGVLFLDEVGELGLDEQAMLLRALEEKRFLPVGADKEVASSFQLICGTNRNLKQEVSLKKFREDLLARINLWTFCLPGLNERPEDIEPNLDYELDQIASATNQRVTFSREAREQFLRFATSSQAPWLGNFRDLNGAVVRMATFAPGGRITTEIVTTEIDRLKNAWHQPEKVSVDSLLNRMMDDTKLQELDHFDRLQLTQVLKVCLQAQSLSDAGRMLFDVSRLARNTPNDADRLRKYLARYGITWSMIHTSREEDN
jgi:transcriptional regulatory protein RtcR